MDDKILTGFLDRLAEDAIKQIKEEGRLSKENALPYLIKDQYTRITHIESEFATRVAVQELKDQLDDFRQEVYLRFSALGKKFDDKFESLHKTMAIGFGFVSLAMAALALK